MHRIDGHVRSTAKGNLGVDTRALGECIAGLRLYLCKRPQQPDREPPAKKIDVVITWHDYEAITFVLQKERFERRESVGVCRKNCVKFLNRLRFTKAEGNPSFARPFKLASRPGSSLGKIQKIAIDDKFTGFGQVTQEPEEVYQVLFQLLIEIVKYAFPEVQIAYNGHISSHRAFLPLD
jgi:hypothetical protein